MPTLNHPTEPLRAVLLDGKEHEFLLTMGGLRRIKRALNVKTIQEVLTSDITEYAIPALYESLRDKGELTEDAFAELLPANLEEIGKLVLAVFGVSLPDQPAARPPVPSPN